MMVKTVNRNNLSDNLNSGKALKAMLGETEDLFDQDKVESEAVDDMAEVDNEADTDMKKEELDTRFEADDENANDDDEDVIYEDDDERQVAEPQEPAADTWDTEEEDLLILKVFKRTPKLPKGVYPALIGPITAKKEIGDNGKPWTKVTISFEVKSAAGIVTVPFIAGMSFNPAGRFYPIIKGVLGAEPKEGLDLRKLQGRQVKVTIDHRVDERGNTWEEIKSAKRIA
mgnify:FL=1